MILEVLVNNPFYLVFLGMVLVIGTMLRMRMSFSRLINFWITFVLYFFRDSSKLEKYTEDNPIFTISGLIFIIGWLFVISGGIRILASY